MKLKLNPSEKFHTSDSLNGTTLYYPCLHSVSFICNKYLTNIKYSDTIILYYQNCLILIDFAKAFLAMQQTHFKIIEDTTIVNLLTNFNPIIHVSIMNTQTEKCMNSHKVNTWKENRDGEKRGGKKTAEFISSYKSLKIFPPSQIYSLKNERDV